jgi:hypothetical protein
MELRGDVCCWLQNAFWQLDPSALARLGLQAMGTEPDFVTGLQGAPSTAHGQVPAASHFRIIMESHGNEKS